MRYEHSNSEWTAIKPMLPNKPRGVRRAMTVAVELAVNRIPMFGANAGTRQRNIWLRSSSLRA
jgi:hypothetical protein